ncbi:acyl-CoA dehydrogenase family protein [Streptomyces sp. NPDC044780]|uniref:acyl-CoA dehydrogenase family protein n=1 Tax=unclassified Streptomyces TaxID=2593676 RepID=UPI0033FB759D
MYTSESHLPATREDFVLACLEGSGENARRWLEALDGVCSETVARHAASVDQERRSPAESLKALRDIGAFGVQIPVSHGGLGLGNAMAALAVERTARACASTAAILMFHYQVVHRTVRYGDELQQKRDLPAMAAGERIAASAWTEPGPSKSKSDVKTSLAGRADALFVEGTKTYCTGLDSASVIDVLVNASTDDGHGPTFVRVDADHPGVGREIYPMLGLRGTSTGTVTLSRVPVSPSAVIGGVGEARQLMRANHETPLNPALLALGIASSALGRALQVVREQAAEPAPVLLSESRAHRLAATTVALESVYAYAARLVRGIAAAPHDAYAASSKLKVAATTVAEDLTRSLTHVVGSRGFLVEYELERHLRDAQATALMGPGNELCLRRIADDLV